MKGIRVLISAIGVILLFVGMIIASCEGDTYAPQIIGLILVALAALICNISQGKRPVSDD